MYIIVITRDGKPVAGLSYGRTVGNLTELAVEAIIRLLVERRRRSGDDLPDGYRIVNNQGALIKAERIF